MNLRLPLCCVLLLALTPAAALAQNAAPKPNAQNAPSNPNAQDAPPGDEAPAKPADTGIDPDHAFGLGLVAGANGRAREAIKHYTDAITAKPDMIRAFIQRGAAYFVVGEYQKAVDDFTEVLRQDPSDTPIRENRGLSYLKLKQYDKALMDFDVYLAANPGALMSRRGSGATRSLYGRGLARLGSGDAAGAYDDITLARQQDANVDKDFADMKFEKAVVSKSDKEPGQSWVRFEEAVQDFDKQPLLVRITIVDDRDQSERTGCLSAPLLRNALRRELGVEDDLAGTTRAVETALANKNRVFHFRNAAALDGLKIPYAQADIDAAKDELKYTDVPSYDGPLPGYRLKPAVAAALACLFIERGKPVRTGTQVVVQP